MHKLLCVARQSAMMATLLMAVSAHAQANHAAPQTNADKSSAAAAKDHPVTAVAGESWLNHLNRQLGDSSMGKTGRVGPPPPAAGDDPLRGRPDELVSCTAQTATLHGADLYRLNCQGCHGATGQGAPPEINSVIDPVRATSVPLVLERMKKVGMEMSRAEATQLAQQAQAALLDRLHNGGKNMPPFPQLNEAEIRAILAYLRQLAGIPGAEHEQVTVATSPMRVGELIVKSTCHTCHSATGTNPTPQQILDGDDSAAGDTHRAQGPIRTDSEGDAGRADHHGHAADADAGQDAGVLLPDSSGGSGCVSVPCDLSAVGVIGAGHGRDHSAAATSGRRAEPYEDCCETANRARQIQRRANTAEPPS